MAAQYQRLDWTNIQEDFTGAVTLLLINGGGTLIDADRFEWACHWEWQRHWAGRSKDPRVWRVIRRDGKKPIYLARELVDAPSELVVDHVNKIPLDNRSANLRIFTQRENCWNRDLSSYKKHSEYKGVSWESDRKKWKAFATNVTDKSRKRDVHLGRFSSEVEAARAYNEYAKTHFGSVVELNPV